MPIIVLSTLLLPMMVLDEQAVAVLFFLCNGTTASQYEPRIKDERLIARLL